MTLRQVQNGYTVKTGVDIGRFVFAVINFVTTMVFVLILLGHAFQMDSITGNQVFHANRVLQSFSDTPPPEIDSFIKKVYGTNTEVVQMVDEITNLPRKLPKMYEISGSDSIIRLEAVHCNFMLFSALWIASAFALAMIHFPGLEPLHWNTIRVFVVHAWNLLGLILTMVLFSATTKWGSIPTSNLFYALIGQVMGWMYQYFHMVECTQVHIATLQIKYDANHDKLVEADKVRRFDIGVQTEFSSELRKIIYMEFSVVAPMLLVAGMMPGSNGLDEWRVQTVLFSSWTLFALLGLHLRYRKSLQRMGTKALLESEDTHIDTNGLDALGYLMYAIIMVFAMLVNAMGDDIFEDAPFMTHRIRQCRWGIRVLLAVSGVLVFETLIKTAKVRFWPNKPTTKNAGYEIVTASADWVLPAFISNLIIIGVGSLLVNILMFAGLSDVNALSSWDMNTTSV
jgi:hypothetical protein